MDIEILLALQQIREGLGSTFATVTNYVTVLGIAIPFVIGVFAYWIFDRKGGLTISLGLSFGNFISQTSKLFFCVYRPWILDSRIIPFAGAMSGASGYSFPSAHTALSSSSCGSAAWVFRKKKALLIGFIVLALLCGFSRNLLGVHTPTDVIAGFVVGIISIVLAAVLIPWLEKGGNRDLYFTIVCFLLSFALMFYFSVKSYPMDHINGVLVANPAEMIKDAYKGTGTLCGFSLGYLFERRAVRFETKGWNKRAFGWALLGAVCGGALFLGLGYAGKAIMPETFANFAKFTLTFFFIIGLWPFVMKRFAWKENQK